MKARFYMVAFFLLLAGVCPSPAQELIFNHVPTPIGPLYGLSMTVVQDPQGIMWIGQGGLHRYDGYKYTSYYHDPQNQASLADDWVEALYATRDGMIWVGTHKGLDRFDPATGIFTHFRHDPNDKSSLSCNLVSAILEDRQGMLWIGTECGLDRFNQKRNTFTHYRHDPADLTSLSHNDIRVLYQDRQGTLWVGCNQPFLGGDGIMQMDGGLNRFNSGTGTFTRYLHDPADLHSLADNRVRAILEDSRGTFWVGTAGDGLHTMDRQKGTFTRHTYDPAHPRQLSRPPLRKNLSWADDHITFIHEDVTGAIWIGTLNNGLNRYDPQTRTVRHYPNFKDPKSGVQTESSWWACSSRDGMLWIAYNQGLFRIDPWQTGFPFVPTGRPVSALCRERQGAFWYATDQGLVREDPVRKTQQRFRHNPNDARSLSSNEIKVLYQDRQGTFWVGTDKGLNRFNTSTNSFTRYILPDGNDSPISCLYEDQKGKFWIGSYGAGLYQMNRQRGTFTRYHHNSEDTTSLGSDLVMSLCEDRKGSLWVGAHLRGVYRLVSSEGRFERYLHKTEDRFRGESCLVQDQAGILWLGACPGLYQSNPALNRFSPFNDPGGELTDKNLISGLLEDRQQGLWVYGTAGIVRLNRMRNQTTTYIPRLEHRPTKPFSVYTGYHKSPQGELYFASGNGYYTFYPNQLTRKSQAPQVVLSALRINNASVVPGPESPLRAPLWQTSELRLSHEQSVFSFDFAGLDYRLPELNRHLFRLEPLDNTWRKAGDEKTAYYYNVPPGAYVFRVKAANSDGIWAERAIRIRIDPPWWRTDWFIALMVVLVAGLVYSGVRYRIAQVRKEESQKAKAEAYKAEFSKKLSEMEMQALRAQMNPHFIFNSLNSINTFILKNEPDSASEYLAKFSRLIRLILHNSNSAVVTLDNELEALRLYLDMESLRFRNKFSYRIDMGPEVEPDIIEIPPLLIQPYVENAIWHGIMHKEEPGHIGITLQMKEDMLVCYIEDDGVGRKRAAELKSKSATKSKSLGMQITAHRIKLINELHGKETTMQIVDLVDASGEVCGTRVVLHIAV